MFKRLEQHRLVLVHFHSFGQKLPRMVRAGNGRTETHSCTWSEKRPMERRVEIDLVRTGVHQDPLRVFPVNSLNPTIEVDLLVDENPECATRVVDADYAVRGNRQALEGILASTEIKASSRPYGHVPIATGLKCLCAVCVDRHI